MSKQTFYFKIIPRLENSKNIHSKSSNSNNLAKIKIKKKNQVKSTLVKCNETNVASANVAENTKVFTTHP